MPIALHVRALHMQNSDIGPDGFDRDQFLAGKRQLDTLEVRAVDDITSWCPGR
jgi:hypothetical protein